MSGRSPCCSKVGLNRGAWTAAEDKILRDYISIHGEGKWRNLPKRAGLKRCGKSCRLRWLNYLRPDIKRGNISSDEEELIIRLHKLLGNRWSLIAGRLPGRTDNEIKNYWNTVLRKRRDFHINNILHKSPSISDHDHHLSSNQQIHQAEITENQKENEKKKKKKKTEDDHHQLLPVVRTKAKRYISKVVINDDEKEMKDISNMALENTTDKEEGKTLVVDHFSGCPAAPDAPPPELAHADGGVLLGKEDVVSDHGLLDKMIDVDIGELCFGEFSRIGGDFGWYGNQVCEISPSSEKINFKFSDDMLLEVDWSLMNNLQFHNEF